MIRTFVFPLPKLPPDWIPIVYKCRYYCNETFLMPISYRALALIRTHSHDIRWNRQKWRPHVQLRLLSRIQTGIKHWNRSPTVEIDFLYSQQFAVRPPFHPAYRSRISSSLKHIVAMDMTYRWAEMIVKLAKCEAFIETYNYLFHIELPGKYKQLSHFCIRKKSILNNINKQDFIYKMYDIYNRSINVQ